jgi:hypothetical protein
MIQFYISHLLIEGLFYHTISFSLTPFGYIYFHPSAPFSLYTYYLVFSLFSRERERKSQQSIIYTYIIVKAMICEISPSIPIICLYPSVRIRASGVYQVYKLNWRFITLRGRRKSSHPDQGETLLCNHQCQIQAACTVIHGVPFPKKLFE